MSWTSDAKLGAVLLLLAFAAFAPGASRGAGRAQRSVPRKQPRVPAPGSAREKWDPLSIRPRVAAAIASGDPARMRELAGLIRPEGYIAEADTLEAAAAAVESTRQP
jgi:hypothetical protein